MDRRSIGRGRVGFLAAVAAAVALAFSAIGVGFRPIPAAAAPGDFTVTPTTLNFGTAHVGEVRTLAVVITNVSSVPQTPNFSGGAPSDAANFGGSQNCAGKTFAPGDTCQFTYTFEPTTAGPHNSTTAIGIDSENFALTMSGTGLSAFTVAPTSLDFGAVPLGQVGSIPVVITNVSSVPQTPNFSGGA